MNQNVKDEKLEAKEWGRLNLVGNSFSSPIGLINITMAGIKETINQPHRYQTDKINALYNIVHLLGNSEYVKSSVDKKDRPFVWHYLKINIAESESFIVIREDIKLRNKCLYSIVDSIK